MFSESLLICISPVILSRDTVVMVTMAAITILEISIFPGSLTCRGDAKQGKTF